MFDFKRPKIKINRGVKKEFSGWIKCSQCKELIHKDELERHLDCCPRCNAHFRMSGQKRIELLADKGSFVEHFMQYKPRDSLQFFDTESYVERLKNAQEKTKRDEAVIVGLCQINEKPVALGVLDFNFMGGSMGSVVGERLTSLIELATAKRFPLIIVSASGGARMQESIFSLMQMAKTAGALAKLHEMGLPYISVLTNPTTGGVTASFATLGDVILAEPDALIGFSGPRIVEQITREKIPPKAQRSEFLLAKGMIDCIVNRYELKGKLSLFLDFFTQEDLGERLKQLIEYGKFARRHSN